VFDTSSPVENMFSNFHTYGAMVDPQEIKFYFDGIAVEHISTPPEANTPMYPAMALATIASSTMAGPPRSDMLVDYVRVYQRKGSYPPAPAHRAWFDPTVRLGVPVTMTPMSTFMKIRAPADVDGTPIIQDNADQAPDELFVLESAGSGDYYIHSFPTGKCLTVSGGSMAEGTPIVLGACTGASYQRFDLTLQGDTSYEIMSTSSQECIGAIQVPNPAGAVIDTWACWNSPGYHYLLKPPSEMRP
jgi:hypothetical protein